MFLVQLLRPSLWVDFFWGVFSRFLPPCQSKSVSCLFCCVFLFSWCLGEISPWQTSIGKAFTLAHLHWCLHWVTDFGYWAIRENVGETMTLSPTSSGLRHSTVLMFFLECRCFGSSSLEVWFMFFEAAISMWHRHFFLEIKCLSNTLLYKTYICLKVFAPSKRKYCVPHNKISLKKDVVSFGKKHILVCRTSHYSSW